MHPRVGDDVADMRKPEPVFSRPLYRTLEGQGIADKDLRPALRWHPAGRGRLSLLPEFHEMGASRMTVYVEAVLIAKVAAGKDSPLGPAPTFAGTLYTVDHARSSVDR